VNAAGFHLACGLTHLRGTVGSQRLPVICHGGDPLEPRLAPTPMTSPPERPHGGDGGQACERSSWVTTNRLLAVLSSRTPARSRPSTWPFRTPATVPSPAPLARRAVHRLAAPREHPRASNGSWTEAPSDTVANPASATTFRANLVSSKSQHLTSAMKLSRAQVCRAPRDRHPVGGDGASSRQWTHHMAR